jgi:exosortase
MRAVAEPISDDVAEEVRAAPWDVQRAPGPRSRWVAIMLVLSGCLPLVFWHFIGLIQRPHYQFIILLPIAGSLLILRHRQKISGEIRPLAPMPLAMLVLSVIGLAGATYYWSPWLGMVSSLLAMYTCLWWAGGQAGLHAWLPAWVLGWLAVPLPFGLDEDLILRLRTATTRMASAVLDQFGIMHLSYANVIELPLKPLFIADACSGIHSLYVLLGVALFVALWLERGVVHTLLLLVATFVLVLMENVARIVAIAAGFQWKMDLSDGPDHMVLGLVLFALSVGLVLSADQFLWFLLPRRAVGDLRMANHPYAVRELTRFGRALRTVSWATATLLAVVFPVIGAAEIYRMPKRLPSMDAVWSGSLKLPDFGKNALPPELAGFERTDYTTIKRVAGDPLGPESQQWTYAYGSTTALVSLDYPFAGVHDLTVCYLATGWTITEKKVVPTSELTHLPGGELGPIAIAHLNRELYGDAVLMFSLVDKNDHIDAVIKELARGDAGDRLNQRFAAIPGAQAGVVQAVSSKAPYVQFQLLARLNGPPSQQGEEALKRLYCEARRELAARVKVSQDSTSPPTTP